MEEQRRFHAIKMALFDNHSKQVNDLQREHQDFIDTQKTQIQQLKEQIETLKRDNTETMKQISDDAQDEIRQIEKKNQHSLNQVTDMGLRSKADLQIIKNKLTETEAEIETLIR